MMAAYGLKFILTLFVSYWTLIEKNSSTDYKQT